MSEKCGRTSKQTGQPCKNPAGPGGTPCKFHGGAAPQVRDAGNLRVVEQEIRGTLARLDVSPVDDPFTELAKLAGQVVAWKDALAARVNFLTGGGCDQCGGGVDELRYEASGAGTEQLRSEVALFERGLDRCASVLGLIAKLNIDERMSRISEKQADAVIRAVDAAIAAAGVSGPAAITARQVAARELRGAA